MMSHSEAARLSRISRQKLEAEIEAYAEQFRPKVIGRYEENGHTVTVLAPAFAEGCNNKQWCKATSGGYGEL